MLEFLREAYPRMEIAALTRAFNARFGTDKTKHQIKSSLSRNRITSGRDGRFKKGCAVWNKGLLGFNLSPATQFRPGNVPANVKPMYSGRLNKDGYIEIKVPERNPHTGAPTRFRLKHRWLWEQEHGPLPEGYVLVFRDGDKRHCALDNLELMRRRELMRMNQIVGIDGLKDLTPDELQALRSLARLQCTIKDKEKAA